ncbi:ankyrin repeat domain-containing protein [Aspergillus clavatus NRRL 1]|uniref:Ankyrin repeat protein n=1 Tax=Aspergillus clavatus (strain ATCC 1007 / CBS 513.65 / DSM 816 / NCTC 3887 / NRRL 1 / QM 1276 / 107) TaxID=344612 RepID=A1CLR4_ASPCL|nr:Ankyrin repeat protein [Aspergillus clavatus NRRL 1]EAW09043.1 Ankyrin repeat protein [Aspergillus clavatus NRRL 1]
MEKIDSSPPSVRYKVIRKAWDALPLDELPDDCDDDEAMKVIVRLIQSGVSLDSCANDGSTILQRAAHHDYYNTSLYLISHGASVNTHATKLYGTPLQEAIKHGHVEVANLLLDHGADLNALPAENRGVTALQAAAIHGMFPMAIRLLESGADVSAPAAPFEGRTAINGAAERGHVEMVQLLLNAYGEKEDLGLVCSQAAEYAEKQGHYEIAQWLRGYSSV